MNPILRTTRRFTVAGMAAGALITGGLAGELAINQHHLSGTTTPSTGSTSGSTPSTPSTSGSSSGTSGGNSYTPVPSVTAGGSGGTDSNTRGS